MSEREDWFCDEDGLPHSGFVRWLETGEEDEEWDVDTEELEDFNEEHFDYFEAEELAEKIEGVAYGILNWLGVEDEGEESSMEDMKKLKIVRERLDEAILKMKEWKTKRSEEILENV